MHCSWNSSSFVTFVITKLTFPDELLALGSNLTEVNYLINGKMSSMVRPISMLKVWKRNGNIKLKYPNSWHSFRWATALPATLKRWWEVFPSPRPTRWVVEFSTDWRINHHLVKGQLTRSLLMEMSQRKEGKVILWINGSCWTPQMLFWWTPPTRWTTQHSSTRSLPGTAAASAPQMTTILTKSLQGAFAWIW